MPRTGTNNLLIYIHRRDCPCPSRSALAEHALLLRRVCVRRLDIDAITRPHLRSCCPSGSPLASCDAGGVRRPTAQPHMAACSATSSCQYHHWKVGVSPQDSPKRFSRALQGSVGGSWILATRESGLHRHLRPGC